MHIALKTFIINVAPTTLLICNGDKFYIHTNKRMKDFKGVASTRINIGFACSLWYLQRQAVGYFINLL
jgi:hypothetical protein